MMSNSQLPGPPSHRLPTVSAAQALLSSPPSKAIPTGLPRLDDALINSATAIPDQSSSNGISRGYVTEVFGPPGAGKTTLAMSIAVNALKGGNRVTWIDTGPPIVGQRFKEVLLKSMSMPDSSSPAEAAESVDDLLNSFLHLQVCSIPHLLALLLHPPSGFLPPGTNFLVIDSMTMLFNSAYPPSAADTKRRATGFRGAGWTDKRWLQNRKWPVAEDIITRLAGLAASRNIAVLLTSHAASTIQGIPRPFLRPAMSGTAWDPNVHFRIALYRSWLPVNTQEALEKSRLWIVGFADVLKKKNSACRTADTPSPFIVNLGGLQGLRKSPVDIEPIKVITQEYQRKRKIDEIEGYNDLDQDAKDENYGWSEYDNAIGDMLVRAYDDEPSLASQQTSEDSGVETAAISVGEQSQNQSNSIQPHEEADESSVQGFKAVPEHFGRI